MSYLKLPKPPKSQVRWEQLRLVVFDCDGVLTDGSIIYGQTDNYFNVELKNFNAHDGMGMTLLHHAGLIPAVITGRSSRVLAKRCKDLKIRHLYQSIAKKIEAAEKLLNKLDLTWDQVVYMGDDWNDVPCMEKAAVSFCPSDACPEIRHLADIVTSAPSGHGAVRECIDHILYQQGTYETAVKSYLQDISY